MPDPMIMMQDEDSIVFKRDRMYFHNDPTRPRPNYCYLDKERMVLVYGRVSQVRSQKTTWEEVCPVPNAEMLVQSAYDTVMVASPADTKRTLYVRATPSLARKMPCDMGLPEDMQRFAYNELFRLFVADTALQRERLIPKVTDRDYRHVKRGTIYTVTALSLLQMDGPEDMTLMVNYRDIKTGQCWTRPVSEFFDGRFSPV